MELKIAALILATRTIKVKERKGEKLFHSFNVICRLCEALEYLLPPKSNKIQSGQQLKPAQPKKKNAFKINGNRLALLCINQKNGWMDAPTSVSKLLTFYRIKEPVAL